MGSAKVENITSGAVWTLLAKNYRLMLSKVGEGGTLRDCGQPGNMTSQEDLVWFGFKLE